MPALTYSKLAAFIGRLIPGTRRQHGSRPWTTRSHYFPRYPDYCRQRSEGALRLSNEKDCSALTGSAEPGPLRRRAKFLPNSHAAVAAGYFRNASTTERSVHPQGRLHFTRWSARSADTNTYGASLIMILLVDLVSGFPSKERRHPGQTGFVRRPIQDAAERGCRAQGVALAFK